MVVIKFILPSRSKSIEFEVLRWTIRQVKEELTIANMKMKLCQFFQDPKGLFLLTWNDGVDDCSLVDEQSIEELLEYAKANNLENDIRITVKPMRSDPAPNEKTHIFMQESERSELPKNEISGAVLESKDVRSSLSLTLTKLNILENSESIHEESNSTVDHLNKPNHMYPESNCGQVPIGLKATTQPTISYPMAAMLFSPSMATWNPMPYNQPEPITSNMASSDMNEQSRSGEGKSSKNSSLTEVMDQSPVPSAIISPKFKVIHDIQAANYFKTHEKHRNLKKVHRISKAEYCEHILEQLRLMGFRQDDKKIKKLIEKYDGDINKIVDKLR